MKKVERIGEISSNSQGYKMMIVEYINCDNVIIEFQDKYKCRVKAKYSHFKDGLIKNPYAPSCYGVGFLGEPREYEHREYKVWSAMLQRCYDIKQLERNPTYKDAVVDDRWLCFANFLEDLPLIEGYELWRDNPNQGVALDKDIKGNGSKIYCLDNCCFVSHSENSLEVATRTGMGAIAVVGINIEDGYVVEFNSIAQASRITNTNYSGIHRCCNNKQKSSGGYCWFYKKDYESMNNS